MSLARPSGNLVIRLHVHHKFDEKPNFFIPILHPFALYIPPLSMILTYVSNMLEFVCFVSKREETTRFINWKVRGFRILFHDILERSRRCLMPFRKYDREAKGERKQSSFVDNRREGEREIDGLEIRDFRPIQPCKAKLAERRSN